MHDFDVYLGLERLMLKLDETNDPIADRIRDLMDPIWRRLSPEEVALLDGRGLIDPATLFPVRLPAPAPARVLEATVSGKIFETPGASGWTAPADWKRAA